MAGAFPHVLWESVGEIIEHVDVELTFLPGLCQLVEQTDSAAIEVGMVTTSQFMEVHPHQSVKNGLEI